MAFSKSNLYPLEDQMISSYANALGYPGRLKIIRKLKLEGPLCVKDIAEEHPISKESLSDHLKILREVQLVHCVERFPYTFYEVDEERVDEAFKLLSDYFKSLEDEIE